MGGAACARRSAVRVGAPLFAVAAASGHLVELMGCAGEPWFASAATEVDTGDWRQYREISAARDGNTVVLYATAADGGLWSWRQGVRGGGLGPPVRVGESIDWSQFRSVFVPYLGYLQAVPQRGPVRTFRHVDWSAGGTGVSEAQPLLESFWGPPFVAARWGGFGEANIHGVHYRIWRRQGDPPQIEHDDVWYDSGELPAGVSAVVGWEPRLYGIDGDGAVVLLNQRRLR
jgi:hypothetical protein